MVLKIRVEEYICQDGTNPYKTWFDGIGEYVIDWGPGYRVYLAKDGDALIILFGGGIKRGQQKDIDRAKALHIEYKLRKKAQSATSKIEKGKR